MGGAKSSLHLSENYILSGEILKRISAIYIIFIFSLVFHVNKLNKKYCNQFKKKTY